MYAGLFDQDERAEVSVPQGRRAWVHVARGELSLNGTRLSAGDGAGAAGPQRLQIHDGDHAEVLVFDLP